MSEIYLPFKEEFKGEMLTGGKTCTSRTKKYGKPGDVFERWGAMFKIVEIKKMALQDVADKLYRKEGFFSPVDFIACWEELHPRVGWVPDQIVYVHFFQKS